MGSRCQSSRKQHGIFHHLWHELATQPSLHHLRPAAAAGRTTQSSFHHLWPEQRTDCCIQFSSPSIHRFLHKFWHFPTNQRKPGGFVHNLWGGRLSTSYSTWKCLRRSSIHSGWAADLIGKFFCSWLPSTDCCSKPSQHFTQIFHKLWLNLDWNDIDM